MDYDSIIYYTLDEEEKERLVEKLKSLLANERVALAYLFGSVTRRSRVRDIDLAVYTIPPLSFREFLRLGTRVELKLGIPIDLVQLQDMNPAFRLKILRHGLPLIIDRQLHHRLISQSFSELMDFKISMDTAKNILKPS
ncbi:MAG: nucleotidyltransferase family protein [Candidatus Lokiarchaeia archaeon]